MTEPEQPATPPLTRRQLREIRNTGATPIVVPSAPDESVPTTESEPAPAAEAEPAPEAESAPAAEPAAEAEPAPALAPMPLVEALPMPAPAPVPEAPEAPPAEDAGHDETAADATPASSAATAASPLTRRQARQQERIRTASVPVITPDLVSAHAAAMSGARTATAVPVVERDLASAPEPSSDEVADTASVVEVEPERVVNPALGAGLLAGDAAPIDLPPSFDQLLSRSPSASSSAPHALIVSQTPAAAPLVAPVTSTGDVLITGTFNLPEGLGSTGHALGAADGKEVDAVLVDGELPAHSSPTPIAASAAISTSKTAGEIIKPPAPEKGSRLMLTLAITAGALALALVGVLILAFVTGVFS